MQPPSSIENFDTDREFFGDKSEAIFTRREHALVGVSPFNGYFTEDVLDRLLDWSFKHFNKVNIFIPDGISAFTLEALGYSKEKAEQKTRKQDRYLKNKVVRALKKRGYSEIEAEELIVTISKLTSNSAYNDIHNKCIERFKHDESFKLGCLSTSEKILSSITDDRKIEETSRGIAVNYFIHELPLFLNTPEILGLNFSIFIYHNPPPYLKSMYQTDLSICQNQGFMAIKIR
jgi:cyclo(L-tyrosyl-L-tyrosyl) synthase